jgi:hypothetical protein
MDGHAGPDGAGLRPRLGDQRALRFDGRGDRVDRGGKGRLDRITDMLEKHAVVIGDGRVENRVMPSCRPRHRGAISFPESGRAFDVGEEEGDDPSGERGHAVLHVIEPAQESGSAAHLSTHYNESCLVASRLARP